MLTTLRTLLTRWFGPAQAKSASARPEPAEEHNAFEEQFITPLSVDERKTEGKGVPVPYDENLLERARTQWQFGDWESLTALSRDTLQHHPDRAKLALLAAAGHLQINKPDTARQFIRLAQDWGCSKKLVSRILIAGVHNSLGRAAAVGGQQTLSLKHFESAIAIGTPGSEVRLITRVRMEQQLNQFGLILGSEGRLQAIKTVVNSPPEDHRLIKKQKSTSTTYSPNAYMFYQDIAQSNVDKNTARFILLDSKSLPRSGIHYMKNTFARLLEDNFSFCEWYQEPGCCKKMPCALTGYAQHCKKTQTSRLRLIKSHDFELTDPVFTPIYSIRRVILVRNPIFLLTSWFALDQLTQYKPVLQKSGINMEKIWVAHEPEVLATAYQVMNDAFIAPSTKVLTEWLEEKTSYISGFLEKWVLPAMENPQPFLHVVRYEELNSFIAVTLGELNNSLPEETRERIDAWIYNSGDQFRARQNPFQAPSMNLTTYITENAHVFQQNANKVVAANRSSVMQVLE